MKRIIISILALATLTGCTKNSDESGNPGETGGNVPIVLNADIPSANVTSGSRAAVETGTPFTAGVAGWETSGTAAYDNAVTWYTTANITASTTAQPVMLATPQVYNANNGIKTYMQAWHPAGEPAGGKVTFPNTDGTVDAMLAGAVVGSKNDNAGKVLEFEHKTTQLKFKVVADPSLAAGTVLKKITVLSVQLPIGFELNAGTVIYGSAAEVDVPGLETPALIPAAATEVGKAMMIRPIAGNTVSLNIETSTATFEGVTATIDTDPDFKEGKAYTITLTFKQQAVALTATVAEWEQGEGSAEVE